MFTIKPSTFLFVFAACQLFATIVTCAPSPIPNPNPDTTNQISNAYSGPGGHASGGGPVTTDLSKSGLLLGLVGGDLLDVGSGTPLHRILSTCLILDAENGGKGGEANSGPAIPGSSHVTVAGAGSSTDPNGSASSSKDMSNAIGNSYSGTGGTADGGDVDTRLSAIKLFSSGF